MLPPAVAVWPRIAGICTWIAMRLRNSTPTSTYMSVCVSTAFTGVPGTTPFLWPFSARNGLSANPSPSWPKKRVLSETSGRQIPMPSPGAPAMKSRSR